MNKWFKIFTPRFLKEDYSPYKCGVSSNKENYDFRARKIHLQNMIKTWVNTARNPFIRPVECRDCLFDTRVPNIYIGRDGLCNMCMTYKKNFKADVLDSELKTFLDTPKKEGTDFDAVVAFSGGKDSSISLYLARNKYDLNVVAVLINNGFIPEEVIENGRKWCQKWGVQLIVLNKEKDFIPYLKKMMDDDFRKSYPCYRCTEMFHKEIQMYCVRHNINRVILGRNWWRWLEPEVRAVRWIKDEESGLNIQFLSLPFALRLTEHYVKNMLYEEGWSPIEIHGNSTNCLLPGLVEFILFKRLGYHPELNLLSREIIAGYIDKERARESLDNIQDLSPILRQIVLEKMEKIY